MRKLLVGLCLALSLSGCGVMQTLGIDTEPLPVSSSLPPLAREAQNAVNEGYVWVAALATVVRQDRIAGLITREEELRRKAQFEDHLQVLGRAQDAIDLCLKDPTKCDLLDAKKRAELIKTGLQKLREELAKRRNAK
jgi:hypothetical protein